MIASDDDQKFLQEFEALRVAPKDFGHRDHLRLAYSYLCANDMNTSLFRFRKALMAFISANNVPPEKYNETVTRAWVQAVRHFMVQAGETPSFDAFIARDDRLLDGDIMLTHYRRETLFSDAARVAYVEPDLDPIPLHP